MEYRSLGRTGLKVSGLCLGTVKFGKATPEDECGRILDRAIDAGINFVDTAFVYGDSEAIIGRALKRNGRRADVLIATKIQPMDHVRRPIEVAQHANLVGTCRGGSSRQDDQKKPTHERLQQSQRRLPPEHVTAIAAPPRRIGAGCARA